MFPYLVHTKSKSTQLQQHPRMCDRCRVSSATYSQQQRFLFASDLASSASDLQAADTKSEEPADIKNIDFFRSSGQRVREQFR